MKSGIELIAAERERQITVEGFDAAHDDGHQEHELAWAAVCYAAPEQVYRLQELAGLRGYSLDDPWPETWTAHWDKRELSEEDDGGCCRLTADEQLEATRINCLIKAGALIAAEIDRLLRQVRQDDSEGEPA